MKPKPNVNTKLIVLAAIALISIILAVVMLSTGKSSPTSSQKTYQLDNKIFSYSLPIDYEVTSSSLESITADYSGSSEDLKSSQIQITRYLKKDPSSDSLSKLKVLLGKSASGSQVDYQTQSEETTKSSKPILIVTTKSSPAKSSIYFLSDSYIWKIDLSAKDAAALSKLQNLGYIVADNIAEK